MKTIVLTLLLSCSATIVTAQEKVLTNESILEMLELGFDEDIILTKIKTSEVDFKTDIADLKFLKEKGASSNIISAMMTQDKETAKEEVLSGIYVINADKKEKILPSVFSGSKTNTLASGLTYGIASAKVKSIINNAQSRNVVSQEAAEFFFYFSPSDVNQLSAQGGTDWWFKTATSPNEFVLVKLKSNKRKNTREMETGSVNVYVGSKVGIDSKIAIPFNIDQISDTEFKVVPSELLEPGEYCFFYQGAIPQGGVNNQSVFDFSVQ